MIAALLAISAAPSFEDVPKIDVHVHFFDDMPELAAMLDRIDMRVINICVRGTQPDLLEPAEMRAEALHQKYKPHIFFCSTFDVTRRSQPGYVESVIAWLDKSYAAGAVTTKIWKEWGWRSRRMMASILCRTIRCSTRSMTTLRTRANR